VRSRSGTAIEVVLPYMRWADAKRAPVSCDEALLQFRVRSAAMRPARISRGPYLWTITVPT
jgi:hypothetical protein